MLRFANGTEPEVLEPALLSGQADQRIARALFDGLVEPDPRTLEPLPAVARSWEIAADGRSYVFHLRPDAVWTNGDRVTAWDIEWSWRRVLDPGTPARLADLMYPIRGARAFKKKESEAPETVGLRAVDDTTFVVELENPTPYFMQLLISTPFLPVHRATVEKHGDRWTRPENIVTNGGRTHFRGNCEPLPLHRAAVAPPRADAHRHHLVQFPAVACRAGRPGVGQSR